MENQLITILGGGIAGLTTAVALQRTGIRAQIYEGSPELHAVGAGLGLGPNAIKAFDAIGLKEQLLARGHSLRSFAILDERGRTITRTVAPNDDAGNFTIHRADLQELLLEQLPADTIRTGLRAQEILPDEDGVTIRSTDGSLVRTSYLIAGEGIHSLVRLSLQPGSLPRHAGYSAWRAVIHAPDIQLDEATETWGPHGRFGIVPLSRGRVYWFATAKGTYRDFQGVGVKDLVKRFAAYHAPVQEIIARTTDDQLIFNDICDLKPLKRFVHGRIVLIGDAAHATTPNLGQGACQAIEDAVVLAQAINCEPTMRHAYRAFEMARLGRTRWVIEASRRLGDVAEIDDPLLIRLRNLLLRMMPPSVNERQLARLADVHFETLVPRRVLSI
jgi:2-polyprenyl-6-methoxyphenol hydroxylase-like FAD-dependent oxidoreductase